MIDSSGEDVALDIFASPGQKLKQPDAVLVWRVLKAVVNLRHRAFIRCHGVDLKIGRTRSMT